MSRPLDASAVLATSAYMTPRERMMLAKMAIMEDEERERDERRERRKTRRASSTRSALERPTSLSSGSSSRKPSILQPKYPSAKSWAQPVPLTPPTHKPVATGSVSAPLSPKSSFDFGPPMTRRSSKVRFVDEKLPTISDEPESPRASISRAPSYRVPVPRIASTNGSIELETIEMKSRPSFALSVTSEDDGADAFRPKPLSYPKVSKALARLSGEIDPLSRQSLSRSFSAPIGSLPQIRRTSTSTSLNTRASYALTEVSETGQSSTSSISLFIPNRSEILAHLLPSPSPKTSSPVPDINRSGWIDDDGGLSPKSSPMALPVVTMRTPPVQSVAAVSPKSSPKALIDQPSPHSNPPPRPQRSKNRSPTNHKDHLDLPAPSIQPATTSPHTHTSSDIDVLDFPVPPERKESLKYTMTPSQSAQAVENMLEMTISAPGDLDEKEAEMPKVENYERLTPAYESTKSPVELSTDVDCVSTMITDARPDSPPLSVMMKKMSENLGESDEDSDLDLSAPLVEVALKSKILSPNSRLLNTNRSAVGNLRRQNSSLSSLSLRTGRVLTSGKGWSGSESEEEEWSMTLKSVLRRKVSVSLSTSSDTSGSTASIVMVDTAPTKQLRSIPAPKKTLARASRIDSLHLSAAPYKSRNLQTPPPPVPSRSPTRPPPSNRVSSSSEVSAASEDLVTPVSRDSMSTQLDRRSSTSSFGSAPGDFPWGLSGPSSPSGSMRSLRSSPNEMRQSSPSLLSLTPLSPPRLSPPATVSSSGRRMSRMPPPRLVDEWGAFEEVPEHQDKYTRYDRPSTVGQARTSINHTPLSRSAYSSSTWTPTSSTDSPPSPSRATCYYVPTSKKVTSRKPVPAFPTDASNLVDLTPKLGSGWRVPSPLFGYEGRFGGGAENDLLNQELPVMVRA